MKEAVAILVDRQSARQQTQWESVGIIANEIGELQNLAKERVLDLVVIDEHRTELTATVSMKLRRINPLCEIWKVTRDHQLLADGLLYDGLIDPELSISALRERVKQILFEKETLNRYGLVGRSAVMKSIARTILRVAPTDISVLIVGPSGSGKELVARALHTDSPHKGNPFVAINCGAIPEGLLEAELFGAEKGAYTGSVAKREGLFYKAHGGTIFLDEIGEMKPDMQVKLLRVLEDGTFYPVGSNSPQRATARVLAATNRDLVDAIAEKNFRDDLYFRLGVVKIILPSLAERRGDVQPLLHQFWRDYPGISYSDSALDRLTRYDWPGNVRQLKNFCARMAALKPQGVVERADVEAFLEEQHRTASTVPVATGKTPEEAGQELMYRAILALGNEVRMLRDLIVKNLPNEGNGELSGRPLSGETVATMDEMERDLIARALRETGGNRKETARRLRIGERTLYRKLQKYNLQ